MQLSGLRLGERFRCIEHERRFDPSLVRALLLGDPEVPCVAYLVHGAVERRYCERFTRNFWEVIERLDTSRKGDGYVDVAQVGATQFGTPAGPYLDHAARTSGDVAALFAGLGEAGREEVLREQEFAEVLAPAGAAFRPAAHDGRTVGACTARSWQNDGPWRLEPHEDRAQLATARDDGFEIGAARGPLTALVVLTDHHGGGELVVWDWAPDDAARARFALLATGYPYPAAALERVARLEMATRAGDFVLLRSDFVHAVKATAGRGRVSVSRFIGRLGDGGDVVYWT